MQNQKTESYQHDDELPPLNLEEQSLVEMILAGKSNTDAYLIAYNAIGYQRASLMVKACRKVAEKHIQAHLRAIRAVGTDKARLTLEDRLVSELAFAQRCEDAGNMGAAGGTYDRINKLMGLYVERFEDISIMDPLQTLASIAQHSPELALKLAKENNITLALPAIDSEKPAQDRLN